MEAQSQPRDPAREPLAKRDALCSECGYDLRGTTGTACPECGKPAWMLPERRWWRFTRLEWAFLAGVLWCVLGILAWVVAIIGTAQHALSMLALWVPGVFVIPLVVVLLVWLGGFKSIGRERPGVARAGVVTSWTLGSVYFVLLILLFVLG